MSPRTNVTVIANTSTNRTISPVKDPRIQVSCCIFNPILDLNARPAILWRGKAAAKTKFHCRGAEIAAGITEATDFTNCAKASPATH